MTPTKIWVRISVEGGKMNIQANVPDVPTIALLEGAKHTLLNRMLGQNLGAPAENAGPETDTPSPGSTTSAVAAPGFIPRRVT
ncbi:MAG: flagellar hook-length control protein FliK [Thermoplasmata archaeon]|nr:flagellar hook-length control protein FliK [Thermoplasmata archaeon]